jgi:hypothetical protein
LEPVKLIVQLDTIRTTKDGGGKITFEFGADALEEIHKLQILNGSGDTNLALAIVPMEGILG